MKRDRRAFNDVGSTVDPKEAAAYAKYRLDCRKLWNIEPADLPTWRKAQGTIGPPNFLRGSSKKPTS